MKDYKVKIVGITNIFEKPTLGCSFACLTPPKWLQQETPLIQNIILSEDELTVYFKGWFIVGEPDGKVFVKEETKTYGDNYEKLIITYYYFSLMMPM